ncbi:hypothetical protein D3C76_1812980 [compost metagenome]
MYKDDTYDNRQNGNQQQDQLDDVEEQCITGIFEHVQVNLLCTGWEGCDNPRKDDDGDTVADSILRDLFP